MIGRACEFYSETAFISIASELAMAGETVTLIGSGQPNPGAPYRFVRAASVAREKFELLPSVPGLRNECVYEEFTFIPHFLYRYRHTDLDVTVTCSYLLPIYTSEPRFHLHDPWVGTERSDAAGLAQEAVPGLAYSLCDGVVVIE
jgi:hypothetical protein